jgi:uncharacterized protein (DUF486 family)
MARGVRDGQKGRSGTIHHDRTAMTSAHWMPILLLIGSNLFMTTAWYGHLKFKESPIMLAILASWGIALIEYCMAVPANRYGSQVYSTAELKTMQEVITLIVFAGFSVLVLKESLTWKHGLGFALIASGAAVIFYKPGVVS